MTPIRLTDYDEEYKDFIDSLDEEQFRKFQTLAILNLLQRVDRLDFQSKLFFVALGALITIINLISSLGFKPLT